MVARLFGIMCLHSMKININNNKYALGCVVLDFLTLPLGVGLGKYRKHVIAHPECRTKGELNEN